MDPSSYTSGLSVKSVSSTQRGTTPPYTVDEATAKVWVKREMLT